MQISQLQTQGERRKNEIVFAPSRVSGMPTWGLSREP
jgi:hypothetical protein